MISPSCGDQHPWAAGKGKAAREGLGGRGTGVKVPALPASTLPDLSLQGHCCVPKPHLWGLRLGTGEAARLAFLPAPPPPWASIRVLVGRNKQKTFLFFVCNWLFRASSVWGLGRAP